MLPAELTNFGQALSLGVLDAFGLVVVATLLASAGIVALAFLIQEVRRGRR